MPRPRLALVTRHDSDELFGDGPFLLEAFDRLGARAQAVPWGAPVDWAGFDAAIVRGTWDYVERKDEFLAWAARTAATTRLINPLDVLTWNTDKTYLRELEAAGVATIPTIWIEPGEPVPDLAWADVVVKPAVSAGARLSARHRRDDRQSISTHLALIHGARGTAMVQPYLPAVDAIGERGVYVFGGRPSHAIRKMGVLRRGEPPRPDLARAAGQIVEPTALESQAGDHALEVLAALPPRLSPVTYARVDTVLDQDRRTLLVELEMVEPYLFLDSAPGAAARYAAAVLAAATP